jgi:hypothetical protein
MLQWTTSEVRHVTPVRPPSAVSFGTHREAPLIQVVALCNWEQGTKGARSTVEGMKHPAIAPVARRNIGTPAVARTRRLQWGLAARLPRWRAFDGRRSRVQSINK